MRIKLIMISLALLFVSGYRLNAQGCSESSSEDGVSVFGFVQPQLEMNMTDPSVSSFAFERARLGVMGNIPYDFSYYMVLELSPFINRDVPYPILLDAFISYKRFEWMKISMGSFKVPFGLETNTPCSGLYTVYRSKATLELVSPFRDLGLMFLGGNDDTKLEYAVGLMNGTGLGHRDDNHFKDIVGRVVAQPVKGISAGASFKYGQSPSAAGLTDPDQRLRIGGEMELNLWKFNIQGEYIWAKDMGSSIVGGGCSGGGEVVIGDKIRSGGYAVAAFNATPTIQPVVKMEFFDPDRSINNNEEFVTTLGVNYFFNDWTRLQLNYRYSAELPVDMPNDAIVLQLQVKF